MGFISCFSPPFCVLLASCSHVFAVLDRQAALGIVCILSESTRFVPRTLAWMRTLSMCTHSKISDNSMLLTGACYISAAFRKAACFYNGGVYQHLLSRPDERCNLTAGSRPAIVPVTGTRTSVPAKRSQCHPSSEILVSFLLCEVEATLSLSTGDQAELGEMIVLG